MGASGSVFAGRFCLKVNTLSFFFSGFGGKTFTGFGFFLRTFFIFIFMYVANRLTLPGFFATVSLVAGSLSCSIGFKSGVFGASACVASTGSSFTPSGRFVIRYIYFYHVIIS